MKKEDIRLMIQLFFVVGMVGFFSYRGGKRAGFDEGAKLGVKASLDTVLSICNKQLQSDTTVSKLILINPDTNVFILSRETLINSFDKE